jgi:putative transposase
MARPLRVHIPGVTYHVMSRGNNKQTIFLDDFDHEQYLTLLERTSKRFGIKCHAYCLMGNHVHLVLTPGEIPISRMMQQLNSAYCQGFNRRHKRVGHVLQGRFKSVMVDKDASFMRVIRYVTRNPVAAGLVELAGDWRWSSGPATLGLVPAPSFLDLTQVWKSFQGIDDLAAPVEMARFFGHAADDALNARFYVGSPAFCARLAPLLKKPQNHGEFVYAEKYAARPPLLKVVMDLERARFQETAAFEAYETHAYTLREIGELFQRAPGTIWTWIQKLRRGRPPSVHLRPNAFLV